MTTTYSPDVTDKYTTGLIRHTARQLVANDLIPGTDFEDVIGELTLSLIEGMSGFDPGRARWSTFVKAVVCRKAVSLVRHRDAERRSGTITIQSLNIVLQDDTGGGVELGNLITEQEYLSGFGYEHESDTSLAAREMDVDAVIATLPDDLKTLCQRLKHESLAAIARDLGMSATTLSYQVQKVRLHFQSAGFDRP